MFVGVSESMADNIFTKIIFIKPAVKIIIKATPLQAWTGPEGSRKLRFPDFVTTAQYGGRLSALRTPYAPAAFTPRKYSWYSFLLEAESTPGP